MDKIWPKLKSGRVFIIAEAGKNFIQTEEDKTVDEYLANAKHLVDEAENAGIDAIKFQTHVPEDEQLNVDTPLPHFNIKNRYPWIVRVNRATPINEFWKPLKAYCEEKGIIFFSTPMSRAAAEILGKLDTPLWKIGSGDVLDFVMLDYIRNTGKPIILSSGMSTLDEVETSFKFLKEKNDRVALVHCVSKYPCPSEDLNLEMLNFYKEKFSTDDSVPIGFSDHSLGIESALVAVAMGATILEKHFSMDRGLWGPDHKVSMTPHEFAELVHEVRALEKDPEKQARLLESDFAKKALGKKEKVIQEGEADFRPIFRKSLMAGSDIPKGAVISADMIYAMRPQSLAGGLASEHYPDVLGKRTKKELKKFEPITSDIIE